MVQDMGEGYRTVVRCAVGMAEERKVEVGLYQDFLFALVMNGLECPCTDVCR